MKTIIIRIRKAGNRAEEFSIYDNLGNTLVTNVPKKQLIEGIALSVEDAVSVIIITYIGKKCCTEQSINIPITTITNQELADWTFAVSNTASLWKHLVDPTIYNHFYGCIHSYILEHPFAYEFFDEIVQNVKDYTKSYKYLSPIKGIFDDNRRIEIDAFFDKAVLYNDQQSSGILNLVAKPINNMKEYMRYPIFNNDSKSILFTKSDNFYQYNTFWNITKDRVTPLFTNSCESMSLDKEVNQDNMDYSSRSFRKDTIRGKDLKVRHILDSRSDIHLVSQFLLAPAQISYK